MPDCLIVSPHFPPSTVAGVHRARHLSKHLVGHGWKPTVVAVHPRHHGETLDPALRTLVPSAAHVVETGAIPMACTAWLGLRGEIGLRGFFHLRAAVSRQMRLQRPSVVLITGSPFYPMLLSSWIQRRFGVPVVLDLQDPWASKEGATRKRWTKGWFSHQLAVMLEPRALAGASWVTSVSERQNAELAERYPWLKPGRMTAIPIGGDPEDFATVREKTQGWQQQNGRLLQFCYVGTALPRAAPLLTLLFQSLARLKVQHPTMATQVRFYFVGTSNQPGRSNDFRVLHLARAAGVEELVTEHPGRVGYLDALQILATSHAVLMIGSDEPHYTASKIYPGLMSGRPFLSFFHRASSAHAILKAAGGGLAIAFDAQFAGESMVAEITAALQRIVVDSHGLGTADPASYASYTAYAVAGQFASVFNTLVAEPQANT